jgi:hypothetical protein
VFAAEVEKSAPTWVAAINKVGAAGGWLLLLLLLLVARTSGQDLHRPAAAQLAAR